MLIEGAWKRQRINKEYRRSNQEKKSAIYTQTSSKLIFFFIPKFFNFDNQKTRLSIKGYEKTAVKYRIDY